MLGSQGLASMEIPHAPYVLSPAGCPRRSPAASTGAEEAPQGGREFCQLQRAGIRQAEGVGHHPPPQVPPAGPQVSIGSPPALPLGLGTISPWTQATPAPCTGTSQDTALGAPAWAPTFLSSWIKSLLAQYPQYLAQYPASWGSSPSASICLF